MLRLFDPFLFGKSSVWRYFLIPIFFMVVTVPKVLPYLFSRTIAIGWFVTGDLSDTFTGPEPDYESLVNAWANQATLGKPLR